MKTIRILGILWLADCCYSLFNLVRAMLELHQAAGDHPDAWSGLVFSFLLNLASGVASIFLFRGARWARWYIAAFAFLEAFGAVSSIIMQKSFPVWAVSTAVFTLSSLALLFLSRHESVA